jgi:hypothetical protein
MRRLLIFVLVPSLLVVSAGFALAAARGTATGDVGTTRIVLFVKQGPEAECQGNGCDIGVIPAIPFRFDGAESSYHATITVSFDYVTTSGGAFDLNAHVAGPTGTMMAVSPRIRPLTASTGLESSTVAFLVDGLHPGTPYHLEIGANITKRPLHRRVSIATSNLAVTVDASAT